MTTEESEKDHALRRRLFSVNQLIGRLEKKLTTQRAVRTVVQRELDALGTLPFPGLVPPVEDDE
jgi:hypothetical protein